MKYLHIYEKGELQAIQDITEWSEVQINKLIDALMVIRPQCEIKEVKNDS